MGKFYISEYADFPQQRGDVVQCGQEPAIVNANSPLTFTTHVESAAFASGTKAILIHTDSICSFKVGPTSAVTATTSDMRMAANQTLVLGVYPGHFISVVSNT